MKAELPTPVDRVLRSRPEVPVDLDVATRGVRARIARDDAHATRQRRLLAIAAPVALAASIALAMLVGLPRAIAELHLRDGSPLPASLEGTVELNDGSVIAAGPGTRLSVVQNDAADFILLLARGETVFEVEPGGTRRWTVECGLATVVVTGTRFTIARDADGVAIEVQEGAVVVHGETLPDRVARLAAGERLALAPHPVGARTIAPGTAAPEVATVPAPSQESTADPAPDAPVPTERSPAIETPSRLTPPVRNARPAMRAWREPAGRGEWTDAYAALGETGLRDEARAASVDDLLALADVARLSGHPREAVAPLERIMNDHASHPSAGIAAFTLGRLESDVLGRHGRALAAFTRALSLNLPRELRADARARLALAHQELGDHDGARRAAARALEEAPQGAFAARMRAILE